MYAIVCIKSNKLITCRKVPTQYNESKFVIAASYAVGFGAIILAPLIFFVTDPVARLMIIGLTIDFGVVISVSIFCVPKIYTAIQLYRQETIRRRPGDTLDRIKGRRNCTCGEKHTWWKFWRHDSDCCSSQGSGRVRHMFKQTPQDPHPDEKEVPTSWSSTQRTAQRGNLGHVHEEDVVRSTTANSIVVDNHKDLNDRRSDEFLSALESERVSLNRPVNSLNRRSMTDRRIVANSATSNLHKRNPPSTTYSPYIPMNMMGQEKKHCPHCGIGLDVHSP